MKKGFSITEFAVSLIIIAILFVIVIMGKNVIRSANVHKVMIAANDMRKSVSLFQIKYNCIPGDCAKASYFLSHHLMDGNGDSQITPIAFKNGTLYENLLAFEHLGEAEMTTNYSGTPDCFFSPDLENINISKLFRNCNYKIPAFNTTVFPFAYYDFYGLAQNSEVFACINTDEKCISGNEASRMVAQDVENLDKIYDDGDPLTGDVLSACTDNVRNFDGFDKKFVEDVYDLTLKSCPVIVRFSPVYSGNSVY